MSASKPTRPTKPTKAKDWTIIDLLKRVVNWFLKKSPPLLETYKEEVIEGVGVTLIRYKRKTARAVRTWRAVYKPGYDIILSFDYIGYEPDVPTVHKRNRLSTHAIHIFRQGFQAKLNPRTGCHEPDISNLFDDEACLEAAYMESVVQYWRKETKNSDRPVLVKDDVFNLIFDRVAMYLIDHPPKEQNPLTINWGAVIERITREVLRLPNHKVFPDPVVSGDATIDQTKIWET